MTGLLFWRHLMRGTTLALTLLVTSQASHAGIYTCVRDGVRVFSDIPCSLKGEPNMDKKKPAREDEGSEALSMAPDGEMAP